MSEQNRVWGTRGQGAGRKPSKRRLGGRFALVLCSAAAVSGVWMAGCGGQSGQLFDDSMGGAGGSAGAFATPASRSRRSSS